MLLLPTPRMVSNRVVNFRDKMSIRERTRLVSCSSKSTTFKNHKYCNASGPSVIEIRYTHFYVDHSVERELVFQMCGHVQPIADGFEIGRQSVVGRLLRTGDRRHRAQADDKPHFKRPEVHF